MFVRHVNGRAFLAACVRIDGQVVQRHLGPATSDIVESVNRMAEYREAERAIARDTRRLDYEKNRALAELHRTMRSQAKEALEAAGFHNPNYRGWRKRRGTGS